MPFDLKIQYAWEYIATRYGPRYADECVMRSGLEKHVWGNPGITVAKLAKFAMKNSGK